VTANRSFYLKFKVDRQTTQGRLLYELGGGDWDIPGLRTMLEKLLPERGSLDGYEVEGEFSALGRRTMILSARQVLYANGGPPSLLLGIDDITERRVLERRLERLLEQKDVLLQELQHRVANSLAIIASILLLKARTVAGDRPEPSTRHRKRWFGRRCALFDAALPGARRLHDRQGQRHINAGRGFGWCAQFRRCS